MMRPVEATAALGLAALLALEATAFARASAPPSPAVQGVAPRKWNPRAPENNQLLPNFSYGSVEPVLEAIGARYERGSQGARPLLRVTLPNNRRVMLLFGSCNGAGACKALGIQTAWAKPPAAAAERMAQAITRFNQRYSFAKALLLSDGRPALQRYLTADYGFIRGNLAVNLLVFGNQAERFAAEAVAPLQPR